MLQTNDYELPTETGQVGQGDLASLNTEQRFFKAVANFASILRTSVGAAWIIGNELNILANEVETSQLGDIIDRSGLSRRSARRFQRIAKNYTEAEIASFLTIQAAYDGIEPARTSSNGQIPMSDDLLANKVSPDAIEPPFTQQEIDAESREVDLLADEAQEADSVQDGDIEIADPDLQQWVDMYDQLQPVECATRLRDNFLLISDLQDKHTALYSKLGRLKSSLMDGKAGAEILQTHFDLQSDKANAAAGELASSAPSIAIVRA